MNFGVVVGKRVSVHHPSPPSTSEYMSLGAAPSVLCEHPGARQTRLELVARIVAQQRPDRHIHRVAGVVLALGVPVVRDDEVAAEVLVSVRPAYDRFPIATRVHLLILVGGLRRRKEDTRRRQVGCYSYYRGWNANNHYNVGVGTFHYFSSVWVVCMFAIASAKALPIGAIILPAPR